MDRVACPRRLDHDHQHLDVRVRHIVWSPPRAVGVGLNPLTEGGVIDGRHAERRARFDPDHHVGDALARGLSALRVPVGESEDRFRDRELAGQFVVYARARTRPPEMALPFPSKVASIDLPG